VRGDLDCVVMKALEKDRERRYQSMRECLIDLEGVTREMTMPSSGARTDAVSPAAAPRAGSRRLVLGSIGVILIVVAALGVFWRYREAPLRVSAADFVQLTNFPEAVTSPSLSPDGRMVAFIRGGSWFLSAGQIYVKVLPDGEARQLTNDPRLKYAAVFTPDGTRITYSVVDGRSWDTWSVAVLGGEPTRVLPNASGLAWIDDRRVTFSEIEAGGGLHMGIVTATIDRAAEKRIYFPAHERAMAHFSYVSPDRTSVLIVEMDRTGNWLPCRLAPFDGSSPGHEVGPNGPCTAAAWAPDGRFMYFTASVSGRSHVWRQRFPAGTPELITTGSTTKEQGVAVAPDGRALVTSVGQIQGSLWVHDTAGERLVPIEGVVSDAQISGDAKRVYCLVDKAGEPHPLGVTVVDLASGAIERILTDFPVVDFNLSPDGQLIAFTTITTSGEHQIWTAPLDRRSSPRLVVASADRPIFRSARELVFRSLEETRNYLARVALDGRDRRRVTDRRIIDLVSVSPDGEWAVVNRGQTGLGAAAEPIDGGEPRQLCAQPCRVSWSPGGRYLYAEVYPFSSRGTLVLPIPDGEIWPELPKGPDLGPPAWQQLPGVRTIPYGNVSLGPDPSVYVFRKYAELTNLFRIPLQ
jgi:Tol biopolymer transport system component